MPLRAVVDGQEVQSPFLTDAEWEALSQAVKANRQLLILPCCGSNGHLRVSKLGTRHFVHNRDSQCSAPSETWQHLLAKNDIALACREAGYSVQLEASGDGWRADVLATKGTARIAFEVQWSAQTWDDTVARQGRYREAGIRCCWFFKTPPRGYRATSDVPLFKLEVTEAGCIVVFDGYSYEYSQALRHYPLSEFVGALMMGRIKFRKNLHTAKVQKVRIVFLEMKCWKCQRPYHAYYMHDLKSGCEETIEIDDAMWEDNKYYFNPRIRAVVQQFLGSPEGAHLKLGTIKKRYSHTVNRAYLSFGCPYCDAICGDFPFREEVIAARYFEANAPAILEREIEVDPVVVSHEHWCFPINGEFCSG